MIHACMVKCVACGKMWPVGYRTGTDPTSCRCPYCGGARILFVQKIPLPVRMDQAREIAAREEARASGEAKSRYVDASMWHVHTCLARCESCGTEWVAMFPDDVDASKLQCLECSAKRSTITRVFRQDEIYEVCDLIRTTRLLMYRHSADADESTPRSFDEDDFRAAMGG